MASTWSGKMGYGVGDDVRRREKVTDRWMKTKRETEDEDEKEG